MLGKDTITELHPSLILGLKIYQMHDAMMSPKINWLLIQILQKENNNSLKTQKRFL
jgi:hypothetical protein